MCVPCVFGQTSPTAFQSFYMALAFDIIDGCGLSNEMRHELLPKAILYLLGKRHLSICTNETELFSFKVGVPCGL